MTSPGIKPPRRSRKVSKVETFSDHIISNVLDESIEDRKPRFPRKYKNKKHSDYVSSLGFTFKRKATPETIARRENYCKNGFLKFKSKKPLNLVNKQVKNEFMEGSSAVYMYSYDSQVSNSRQKDIRHRKRKLSHTGKPNPKKRTLESDVSARCTRNTTKALHRLREISADRKNILAKRRKLVNCKETTPMNAADRKTELLTRAHNRIRVMRMQLIKDKEIAAKNKKIFEAKLYENETGYIRQSKEPYNDIDEYLDRPYEDPLDNPKLHISYLKMKRIPYCLDLNTRKVDDYMVVKKVEKPKSDEFDGELHIDRDLAVRVLENNIEANAHITDYVETDTHSYNNGLYIAYRSYMKLKEEIENAQLENKLVKPNFKHPTASPLKPSTSKYPISPPQTIPQDLKKCDLKFLQEIKLKKMFIPPVPVPTDQEDITTCFSPTNPTKMSAKLFNQAKRDMRYISNEENSIFYEENYVDAKELARLMVNNPKLNYARKEALDRLKREKRMVFRDKNKSRRLRRPKKKRIFKKEVDLVRITRSAKKEAQSSSATNDDNSSSEEITVRKRRRNIIISSDSDNEEETLTVQESIESESSEGTPIRSILRKRNPVVKKTHPTKNNTNVDLSHAYPFYLEEGILDASEFFPPNRNDGDYVESSYQILRKMPEDQIRTKNIKNIIKNKELQFDAFGDNDGMIRMLTNEAFDKLTREQYGDFAVEYAYKQKIKEIIPAKKEFPFIKEEINSNCCQEMASSSKHVERMDPLSRKLHALQEKAKSMIAEKNNIVNMMHQRMTASIVEKILEGHVDIVEEKLYKEFHPVKISRRKRNWKVSQRRNYRARLMSVQDEYRQLCDLVNPPQYKEIPNQRYLLADTIDEKRYFMDNHKVLWRKDNLTFI
uniref:CFAP91 domain-containing protein n=1 Tax=Rhabditophanes sp. KR3021 TaxID=114890 RepID=A0AC35U5Y5_9BILA